jgi:hypothetical protein
MPILEMEKLPDRDLFERYYEYAQVLLADARRL